MNKSKQYKSFLLLFGFFDSHCFEIRHVYISSFSPAEWYAVEWIYRSWCTIHLLVNVWLVDSFGLLQRKRLWAFVQTHVVISLGSILRSGRFRLYGKCMLSC